MSVTINDRSNEGLEEMLRISSEVCIIDFAMTMADFVRINSPYDLGHNRSTVRLDPVSPSPGAMVIRIVTESGYGGYLETGTDKMPAQPYFGPSFEETRSEFGV